MRKPPAVKIEKRPLLDEAAARLSSVQQLALSLHARTSALESDGFWMVYAVAVCFVFSTAAWMRSSD